MFDKVGNDFALLIQIYFSCLRLGFAWIHLQACVWASRVHAGVRQRFEKVRHCSHLVTETLRHRRWHRYRSPYDESKLPNCFLDYLSLILQFKIRPVYFFSCAKPTVTKGKSIFVRKLASNGFSNPFSKTDSGVQPVPVSVHLSCGVSKPLQVHFRWRLTLKSTFPWQFYDTVTLLVANLVYFSIKFTMILPLLSSLVFCLCNAFLSCRHYHAGTDKNFRFKLISF